MNADTVLHMNIISIGCHTDTAAANGNELQEGTILIVRLFILPVVKQESRWNVLIQQLLLC